ncbi:inosine 5'-monophosphate dehydrogenase [Maioricimonas rarisocia]|uniref:Inosine 5'-monophosphate dehydrogenase n=1 Tax=Maioricimonas rarisocia TaxID=2528026 RepID=A0A517ZBX6_9PLAN|nr:CBS domain-containing protein [Maioricimonas rarisocia]QDU40006.1 inosine 5'-monophosphate dehydrogenase [Maioricimonas rarisocia]
MTVTIAELMAERVITVTPHQTFEHVKKLMQDHQVSCVPVIGPDNDAVGIVTATDLLADHARGTPVSRFMTPKVFTVPLYGKSSLAARVMRNHHIHHVVVTHEQQVAGILSSFDLLRLVEDHRFVMKPAPSTSKRGGKRKKTEFSESAE